MKAWIAALVASLAVHFGIAALVLRRNVPPPRLAAPGAAPHGWSRVALLSRAGPAGSAQTRSEPNPLPDTSRARVTVRRAPRPIVAAEGSAPAPASSEGAASSASEGSSPGASGVVSGPSSGSSAPGLSPGTGGDGAASHSAQQVVLLHERLAAAARGCYPPAARRFRIAGEARLAFCLDDAGRAVSSALKSSSGHAMLDESTISCVLPAALPVPGAAGCYELPVRFGER